MIVLIMANISGHPDIPETKHLGPPNLCINNSRSLANRYTIDTLGHYTGCNEEDGAVYNDISNSNHFYSKAIFKVNVYVICTSICLFALPLPPLSLSLSLSRHI